MVALVHCRAISAWREVVDVLSLAGIETETHETSHSGHATEIAAMVDTDHCAVLAVVGGDGTLHEVVQV
jgi:diacylglycerol kinase family enzyme